MKRLVQIGIAAAIGVLVAVAPVMAKGGSARKRNETAVKRAKERAADRKRDRKNRSPGVNRREKNQRNRIGQGVRSGQLTKDETKELVGEQREIRKLEREMKSDVALTKAERKTLHGELNDAGKNIYAQKHDDESTSPRRNWKKWDPGVNQRQRNQKFRIKQGIRGGSLTKGEAGRIIHKEQQLNRLERELKSDGTLTRDERKTLHQELNELSRKIYGEKHDDQTRPKLNRAIVAKIESGEITASEAKELYRQMERVHQLKRILASKSDMTDAQRSALEEELTGLLANLHE